MVARSDTRSERRTTMNLAVASLATLLSAQTVAAVPPPPPLASVTVGLTPNGCAVERSGSAAPYAPAPLRFRAPANATLLLVLPEANPNLTFDLKRGGQRPLITGAGDVRIVLPAADSYELAVSGYDPVRRVAVPVTFRIKLALEVYGSPRRCSTDRRRSRPRLRSSHIPRARASRRAGPGKAMVPARPAH